MSANPRIALTNNTKEEYSFDEAQELIALSTADREYSYTRDSLGRITLLQESSQNIHSKYHYDPKGQLIQSNNKRFIYDKAGNNLHNQSQYNPTTNQLLQNATHTFAYDKRGNLIAKIEKATSIGAR